MLLFLVSYLLEFFSNNCEHEPIIFSAIIFLLTVAVYLRGLRIRAAEEKNIPRPSRELKSCKKNTINLIFHIYPSFDVTDTYHLRITLVN